MDPITRAIASAAAGAAAAGEATYVDDVFSTFLYDGNNTSGRDIVNGIDLSGEGGLVWVKRRATNSEDHVLLDTERGANNFIMSNRTNAANTSGGPITAFNSNGFEVDNNGYVNGSDSTYVSWTFRKAPGFFDVVTYSGTGSVQNISHSLGSVPGMILIKMTSSSDSWIVYHRALGATHFGSLNSTNQFFDNDSRFNDTEPTASVFTVGTDNGVNQNGQTFVAYLFAHDDQSFGTNSDEAIIKCGSYTGTGGPNNMTTENTSAPNVDLGFEPQWLLIRGATRSDNWYVIDTARGFIASFNGPHQYMRADRNSAEATFANFAYLKITNQGFKITAGSGAIFNESGETYIYTAIRRPHKPPTAGTEVFAIDTKSAASTNTPQYTSGFPVDLAFRRNNITSSDNPEFIARLTNSLMYTNSTSAEVSGGATFLDYFAYNNGWANAASADSNDYLWMFKRAPGFFDVVDYTGNGGSLTVNHNLTVIPEISIIKPRSSTGVWAIEVRTDSFNARGRIDSTSAVSNSNLLTSVTATSFALPSFYNTSGRTYIVYLFASLDGISKIGTYSGTGSNVNVDCGFTAGARFVLIKRTDSTGTDWYVWDTTRGIVSGNDPYFLLNETAAQVTSTDYIDPLNAGFTVTSSAPAALNTSGGTYLFLAIA